MPNDNLPVGTVIIWAGDPTDLPNNWKVCNGKALNKNTYSDLFSVLGTNWDTDTGASADFFNIPDLRGVFLRGVNDGRNDDFRDPSIEERVRLKSDSTLTKDAAGSFQYSAVGKHEHFFDSPWNPGGDSNSGTGKDFTSKMAQHTWKTKNGFEYRPHSDNEKKLVESRPVNAYVYFIIKVKMNPTLGPERTTKAKSKRQPKSK